MSELFTEESLGGALQRFAELVPPSEVGVQIYIAGGAAMLIHFGNARRATSDVDVKFKEMTNCLVFIEQVAREQDLSKDWLNSKMVGFLSVQDRETDWLKWKTFGTVTYYVASTEYLFALKLNAGRPGKDSYDLKLLISELNIKSISHAEEIFERYFPGETPTEATTQLVLALLGDV